MSSSILHTVNKSPFTHSTLLDCLNRLGDNDTILLLEDGVYAALATHSYADKMQSLKVVYAMEHDILARGLQSEQLLSHIQLIDDVKFVTLSTQHSLVHSWY